MHLTGTSATGLCLACTYDLGRRASSPPLAHARPLQDEARLLFKMRSAARISHRVRLDQIWLGVLSPGHRALSSVVHAWSMAGSAAAGKHFVLASILLRSAVDIISPTVIRRQPSRLSYSECSFQPTRRHLHSTSWHISGGASYVHIGRRRNLQLRQLCGSNSGASEQDRRSWTSNVTSFLL